MDSLHTSLLHALRRRADLIGWTLRRQSVEATQVFTVGAGIEAKRQVSEERFIVDVLVPTQAPDGTPACGTGNATLLPDDAIEAALDKATDMAGHVHNPPHGLPGKADLPEVPLHDPVLSVDAEAHLQGAFERILALAEEHREVRLTATEWHAQKKTTHLVNSRGMEAEQTESNLQVEWVLVTGEGDGRAESFFERSTRRMQDLGVESEFLRLAEMTVDRQKAAPAPTWDGPVVLRGNVLATFLNGGPLQFLASAANRYANLSAAEIGKSILRREGSGDSLTVYANRILPFGLESSRFDGEGIPGQRLLLVADNVLQAFSASQRYAEYLGVPATGAFGDLEIPPGKLMEAELLSQPHVEVAGFSWFNPDPVTGDFATEIRLGYLIRDGRRTPFRGGMLIGNFLDVLGEARWSQETGFFGDYFGPRTVRLTGLKLSGHTAG